MIELDILLVIIVFAGLLGTLVPSMPGTGIILIAAIVHALVTEFSPLTWQTILSLTVLCFVGYAGQYLVTAATSRKMGASKYGIIGACVGMFVGFIMPIPGGIFAGTFIGAVLCEIFFALKDLQEALKAGTGALLGTLLSLFFEFMVGMVMAVIICYQIFSARL
ncbi:MAG: DUF456 domain-containing protein [Thermodesulfobacteriota bacterium]